MNVNDELRAQLRETAARIAELEAENLRHAGKCARDLYLLRRAEARLAAVIHLCDVCVYGDKAVTIGQIRAAAEGN